MIVFSGSTVVRHTQSLGPMQGVEHESPIQRDSRWTNEIIMNECKKKKIKDSVERKMYQQKHSLFVERSSHTRESLNGVLPSKNAMKERT